MGMNHRDEILQQIAAGLHRLSMNRQIGTVKVTLATDTEEYVFGLPEVLDVLANDLFWDERGNWAEARIAKVDTF